MRVGPEDEEMLTDGEDGVTVVWETSSRGGGDGGGGSVGGGGGGGFGRGEATDAGATGAPEPPPADEASDEYGDETDANGNVIGQYHIHTVTHPDGSSEFSRTDTNIDGSTSEAYGGVDAEGNGSYSERVTHADGSSVLVTRTNGPDGHGTEQKTWVDANGNTTDEETTDF
jgi:hypothetical protein